jgi:hypothetical protein
LLISNLTFSQQRKETASEFLFPNFTSGIVMLKDNSVINTKLNYDTFTNQMLYMGADSVLMTFAEPEKVNYVAISNRNFFYIKNYFAELQTNGPILLYSRIHNEKISDKAGSYASASPATRTQAVSSIGSLDGRLTGVTEDASYIQSVNFYVTINDKTRVVSNQNDFLKCFPSKKELIKVELEKQSTKFSSIEAVKKLVDWMNANGIKD